MYIIAYFLICFYCITSYLIAIVSCLLITPIGTSHESGTGALRRYDVVPFVIITPLRLIWKSATRAVLGKSKSKSNSTRNSKTPPEAFWKIHSNRNRNRLSKRTSNRPLWYPLIPLEILSTATFTFPATWLVNCQQNKGISSEFQPKWSCRYEWCNT